jgi:hypothetical protein
VKIKGQAPEGEKEFTKQICARGLVSSKICKELSKLNCKEK